MSRTDQNLRDSVAINEKAALWSAAVVVFGLFLEVIFAAAFHEPPETILSHWGPVAADCIVALGVAGEVFFGRKSRTDSEELSRRSEERAARLEKEAADARERTTKIEQQMTRRTIPAEQRTSMADRLREILSSHSPNIIMEWEQSDAEAFLFAWDIAKVLKDAGYSKIRSGQNHWGTWPIFGVHICGRTANLDPDTAVEFDISPIVAAFKENGIYTTEATSMIPAFVPAVTPIPILYIFVATKLPSELIQFAQ